MANSGRNWGGRSWNNPIWNNTTPGDPLSSQDFWTFIVKIRGHLVYMRRGSYYIPFDSITLNGSNDTKIKCHTTPRRLISWINLFHMWHLGLMRHLIFMWFDLVIEWCVIWPPHIWFYHTEFFHVGTGSNSVSKPTRHLNFGSQSLILGRNSGRG